MAHFALELQKVKMMLLSLWIHILDADIVLAVNRIGSF